MLVFYLNLNEIIVNIVIVTYCYSNFFFVIPAIYLSFAWFFVIPAKAREDSPLEGGNPALLSPPCFFVR